MGKLQKENDPSRFHFVGQGDIGDKLKYLEHELKRKNYKETLGFIIDYYKRIYDDDITQIGENRKRPKKPKVEWDKHYFIPIEDENYFWLKRFHGLGRFFSIADIIRRFIQTFYVGYKWLKLEGFWIFIRALVSISKAEATGEIDPAERGTFSNIQYGKFGVYDEKKFLRLSPFLKILEIELRTIEANL